MSNAFPTPDPYASYLQQADDLFARGEVVKAGQIWQAILKQQPAHAEARERLMALRQHLLALQEAQARAAAPPPAPEPAPPAPVPAPAPVPPALPPPPGLEPDRLLLEGCTLYDMGQVQDALLKWEQVLAVDPGHALARSYAEGARRELGLPPLPAPQAAAPPAPEPLGDEDVEHLLREAVQLYDMGLTEEAISKWERVLALEPHRTEVEGYLQQARKEVTQVSPPPGTPRPAPTPAPRPVAPPPVPQAPIPQAPVPQVPGPEAEGLDLKLRQADHLLQMQRYEEAAFTFQQALRLDPGNRRALEGLERCRPAPALATASQTTQPVARIEMVEEEVRPAETRGVEPPAALLKATAPPREGLALPERLQAASRHLPWLKDPKVLAALGGGLLVLAGGAYGLHTYRQEQALKEAVKAARAAALAPVLQQAQAPDLAETPAAIREEAEAALDGDPLRAYLRAQTLVAQFPGEAAGPQLLEKARTALAGGAVGASLPEFQKHLQGGDLEAAAKVMDALLRAQPEEAGLRARAARLHLYLCEAHAAQGKWEAATDDLRRGRALFPGDKAWQARLRLLEQVKALPKAQRAAWIPMLG